MPGFSDAAIDEFLAHAIDLAVRGAPLSEMVVFRIGQGIAAVPDEATAFSHRDARYLFHPITAWADPADDERMIAATRAFAAAMRPFATGAAYLNFTPEADRVRDAYGDATYARLVAVKDRYDPANLSEHPAQPRRGGAACTGPGLGLRPRGLRQLLLGEQAMLHREHRGRGPAGGVDAGVDVLDLVASRLRRDDQPFGYLLGGQATGEQDEHLDLAGGQAGQGLPAPRQPVPGRLEHGVHGRAVQAAGPDTRGGREIAPPDSPLG